MVNEWPHHLLLRMRGLRGYLNHRSALESLGLESVVGCAVGFRTRGTLPSPAWRASARAAGLEPVDDEVRGDEYDARSLTELEVCARAAELAVRPDVSLVAIIGVAGCLDAIAGVCARNGKTLLAADHVRAVFWSFCRAADMVVQLGIDSYELVGEAAR